MRTVKEVSEITGISIRALRYYDEIGLLKPSAVTEAGYRLYDDHALARLQEIMFFRELELSLDCIKQILENPNYDKEQILRTQKALLEQKRNRLNRIIELIEDVAKGVNTMSFEAFTNEDVKKIIDHSLQLQDESSIAAIIQKYGSLEHYQDFLAENLMEEKTNAHLIKLYGSKDKAVDASLSTTGNQEELKIQQEETDRIYRQFTLAMETDSDALAQEAVHALATNYKNMFYLDNARNLLLEVAAEYLNHSIIARVTDKQYGTGITEYIGHAIQKYYGV